jgi:hypothetical protein
MEETKLALEWMLAKDAKKSWASCSTVFCPGPIRGDPG